MKIGELAHASATPVATIRFYEREGLLPAPHRTESNYRIYTDVHADRLGFIRQCRNLDMTLEEVHTLLRFKDEPQKDCGEVNALLDEHIGHVTLRINELRSLETTLHGLRTRCVSPHAAMHCGILQGIEAGVDRPAPRRHLRGAHSL